MSARLALVETGLNVFARRVAGARCMFYRVSSRHTTTIGMLWTPMPAYDVHSTRESVSSSLHCQAEGERQQLLLPAVGCTRLSRRCTRPCSVCGMDGGELHLHTAACGQDGDDAR